MFKSFFKNLEGALAAILVTVATTGTATAGGASLGEVAWIYANATLANGDRAFGNVANLGFEMPKGEVAITEPGAEVASMCLAFSGVWVGEYANGRPLLLVVTAIAPNGSKCKAAVSVGWGSEPGKTIDISTPWKEVVSKRWRVPVLARSGRNVPVTYTMDGQRIKKGVLRVQMTSSTRATFKILDDGTMSIDWGGGGKLTKTSLAAIVLQELAEPSEGFKRVGG